MVIPTIIIMALTAVRPAIHTSVDDWREENLCRFAVENWYELISLCLLHVYISRLRCVGGEQTQLFVAWTNTTASRASLPRERNTRTVMLPIHDVDKVIQCCKGASQEVEYISLHPSLPCWAIARQEVLANTNNLVTLWAPNLERWDSRHVTLM